MRQAILTALLAVLSLVPATFAAKAEVVDNAGFFSADAVSRANQALAEIEQKHGRQMRVETYAAIPDGLRARYSDANRRQFFQDWARQRAQQEGLRGVIVLICRNPSSLQVEVGRETASSGAFTLADRARLSQDLLSAMKAKEYDRGLLDAVKSFQSAVAKAQPAGGAGTAPGVDALPVPQLPSAGQTAPPPQRSPAPQPMPTGRGGGWSWGAVLFIVILLFIGLSIIRRIFAGGQKPSLGPGQHHGYGQGPNFGPGMGPQQYGGSGFGRGFGGGLLGGLLGGWAANEMFRNTRDHSAHASPPPTDTGGTFSEPSGGAFDGGGDFGGGGDFSGGGGDAGSGGGDF